MAGTLLSHLGIFPEVEANVVQVGGIFWAWWGNELERRNLGFYLSLAWRAPEIDFTFFSHYWPLCLTALREQSWKELRGSPSEWGWTGCELMEVWGWGRHLGLPDTQSDWWNGPLNGNARVWSGAPCSKINPGQKTHKTRNWGILFICYLLFTIPGNKRNHSSWI